MKLFLLINVKMPTIVGILTFMSRKNSLLHLSEPEKSWISWYFYTYEHLKFHAQLSWVWKKFYNLGPWFESWLFANTIVCIINFPFISDVPNLGTLQHMLSPLYTHDVAVYILHVFFYYQIFGMVFAFILCRQVDKDEMWLSDTFSQLENDVRWWDWMKNVEM